MQTLLRMNVWLVRPHQAPLQIWLRLLVPKRLQQWRTELLEAALHHGSMLVVALAISLVAPWIGRLVPMEFALRLLATKAVAVCPLCPPCPPPRRKRWPFLAVHLGLARLALSVSQVVHKVGRQRGNLVRRRLVTLVLAVHWLTSPACRRAPRRDGRRCATLFGLALEFQLAEGQLAECRPCKPVLVAHCGDCCVDWLASCLVVRLHDGRPRCQFSCLRNCRIDSQSWFVHCPCSCALGLAPLWHHPFQLLMATPPRRSWHHCSGLWLRRVLRSLLLLQFRARMVH